MKQPHSLFATKDLDERFVAAAESLPDANFAEVFTATLEYIGETIDLGAANIANQIRERAKR